ncbi:MAG TPA: hypothetical protein VJH97_01505 [Candidatus Nanoarchaeia archaeon]|nr:hypothetical protein [Candidatus Nanoarchaeia archaeon]
MKLEFDLEKEDSLTLRYVKRLIERKIGTEEDIPSELLHPWSVLMKLEQMIGHTIPCDDLEAELKKDGVPKKDTAQILSKLMKAGLIFEPRRGFIQRI